MQKSVASQWHLCILLIVALFAEGSSSQTRHGFPTPPAPAVSENSPRPSPPNRTIRLDSVAIETEAKEMAVLASSIPGDIEQMKIGLLPRDTFDKLKRIEKLSKQLRAQLRP